MAWEGPDSTITAPSHSFATFSPNRLVQFYAQGGLRALRNPPPHTPTKPQRLNTVVVGFPLRYLVDIFLYRDRGYVLVGALGPRASACNWQLGEERAWKIE